ncbi:MAG TPA: ComF family protein [Pyrinomonadaceae bacterium]|nr:ComF family protein [Pyrinomonadaceae bacterium]
MIAELIYDAVLTLAYPQACAICGRSVEQRKFGVACESCWNADDADELHDRVRGESDGSTVVRAVGLYEGALRESVLLLKRQPHIASHLAELLVADARGEPLNTSTIIVPVPLHAERMRSRGFNQASVVAQALSKSLRLPVDETSLRRIASSEKYRAGLDARGRMETVSGAFEVRNPRAVADEIVLLVDDVFTTGATVSACAQALTQAGAREVFVLTIARARNQDFSKVILTPSSALA